ncbi:MAG TPA: VOC family protein [Opitutaceae bacterium]|jgi:predicted enzyme related to lactoylglutathione lyase
MAIKIKEFAFACHPVADIARARGFYGNLLGLKEGMSVEFAPGKWWIEYDVAGVALAISNAFQPGPSGCVSVALEVDDLDSTLAAVKAAGIPLAIEPAEFPPCRMFGISSPDGHTIIFHRRKH